MINKLLLTIGISLAFSFCSGFSPTAVWAQCDCGQCGDCVVGYADDAGAIFEQNVGSGQSTRFPGCDDRSCIPEPCCPAKNCGPYVSIFGGWSTVDNFASFGITSQQTQTIPDNPTTPDVDETLFVTTATQAERSFQTGDGAAWGIAIGRQVHAQARLELEAAYRENDFDSLRVAAFTDTFTTSDPNATPVFDNLMLTSIMTDPAVGNLQSYSLMGNFLYDFSPRWLRRYNLYGGAGIGAINVSGTATTATNVYDVSDTTFAYQIIGGVNKSLNQRIDLFVDYRYMSASSITVFDVTSGVSLGSFDFDSNSVFFGMRFRH